MSVTEGVDEDVAERAAVPLQVGCLARLANRALERAVDRHRRRIADLGRVEWAGRAAPAAADCGDPSAIPRLR